MDNEIHPDDLEIIRDTVKRLQAERDQHLQERHDLRAENKLLQEALTKIQVGEHDPAMDDDPIEDDVD